MRRCNAYLEWHPDKCTTLTAGPRAEKIRLDWFCMIGIAHDVASDKAARERYWKYGIWTDGNLGRAGNLTLPLKVFSMYKFHPMPADATIFEWVMTDATEWHEEFQKVQELQLETLIRDTPVADAEFVTRAGLAGAGGLRGKRPGLVLVFASGVV